MTVAPPPSYPGSRVLARWWRELESFRPRCLWVGYVGLHRVEGSVRVISPVSLGRMEALLLDFLESAAPAGVSPPWERLSLNPAFIFRVLNALAGIGLVTRTKQRTWTLTPQGVQALTHGNYEQVREERRVFPFLSAPDGDACHFVRLLSEPPSAASFAWPDPRFDPADYQMCFTQSAEWKRRHVFPENVSAAPAVNELLCNGQSLIVDPRRVALAVARTGDGSGDDGLIGLWMEPGRWILQRAEPAFHLTDGWREFLPFLETDPATEACQRAWQVWCQPRSLPQAEVERCSLHVLDCRLIVHAPRRLIDRLQTSRSDALKGEAWVLLGEGPVRRAALLEIVEAGAEERKILGQ